MSSSLLHQRAADPLKPLVSAPQWIWTVATALRGIMDWKLRHIRPHGNFMYSGRGDRFVPPFWCLMVSFIRPQVGENPNLVLVTDETREFTVANHDAIFIWCPCVSSFLMSILNEWWILNRQSSIISPWLLLCNCWSFVLVERWRTAAFSQFCLQIALPYKKGNRKLIVPWPSFNTHCTTNNAHACLLSH